MRSAAEKIQCAPAGEFFTERGISPVQSGVLLAAWKGLMMKRLVAWLLEPPNSAPKATLLIRLMAGGVFLWEGILKFVYTNQGVGRFTKIGIPIPHVMAPLIAVLEIVGGLLLISGLLTRLISVPFVIEMLVAMASTKIALYLGTSPLPLPPAPPKMGIWAVLHEIRSDYAQIMSVLFLGIVGPGPWSLDAVLRGRRRQNGLTASEFSTRAQRSDQLRLAQ